MLAAETIPQLIHKAINEYGAHEAIVLGDNRRTYAELERRSAKLARALLGAGVGKASRVGILLGNGPDWIEAWFAITRIGAVTVPLSTFSKPSEISKTIAHADLQFIFFQPALVGRSFGDLLEQALPELTGQVFPLQLAQAPFLRGIACFGQTDHTWAVTTTGLADGALAPLVSEEVLAAAEKQVDPEDWAFIIYTSGSTAEPKGVIHSHRNIMLKCRDTNRAYRFELGDRCYHSGPWFWVGGLVSCLFPAVSVGATIFCTETFEAGRILDLLERERLTNVDAWPHQVEAMVAHPAFENTDRSSLGPMCFATPLLPPGREPRPAWSACGVGMTETLGMYGFHDLADPPPPPELIKSEGKIRPGFEVRMIDADGNDVPDGEIGEFIVRGGTTAVGLYKQPRARSYDRDGWFHTGDLGVRNGDYLSFRSRQGDMIKTSGANVAPPEVEAALYGLPGVREAYVAGIPDEIRGQILAAAVVLEPEATLTAKQARDELRTKLSTYKVPAHIFFVKSDEIPRSPNDKFKRAALVELMRPWVTAEQ